MWHNSNKNNVFKDQAVYDTAGNLKDRHYSAIKHHYNFIIKVYDSVAYHFYQEYSFKDNYLL